MIRVFDLDRRLAQNRASVEAAFARVVDSGQFVLGEEVSKFERDFAEYLGVSEVIGVGNGTDAIYLALASLGLNNSSTIATVANAGYYSSAAIQRLGGKITYLDVDPMSSNINFESLQKLSEPIHAIIVTHLYGRLVDDIEKIAKYCFENGITLIEDCAQATGASLNGRMAGSFGQAASFSFYPTKNLGALGDGGAVATNSKSVAAKVRSLREYGWAEKYSVEVNGGINSRLDELQAAFLNDFLPKLNSQNLRRKEIAQSYSDGIAHPDVLSLPLNSENYVCHLYVIRTKNRKEFVEKLRLKGISTAIHYPIPDHEQGTSSEINHSLPITELLASEVLTLPCYPELSDSEVFQIIDAINTIQLKQRISR